MIRKCIARLCRSIRKSFQYLCTLDNEEAVKGIADTMCIGPRSKEEKAERIKKVLLFGVKQGDRDKVLRHLEKLRSEVDPLESSDQIPDDCIRSAKLGEISNQSE